MKLLPLPCLLICLLLCSCSTTVYRNGQPALRTYANARGLEFRSGDVYFKADSLDHSTATRAASALIGTSFSGSTGMATAALLGIKK